MVEELLSPKTSNEDLLNKYQEIETDGGKYQFCEGNISHDCVQDSINQLAEIYQDTDEWVLAGGIPIQLMYLQEKGESSETLMREFGNRNTSDIDVITTNPGEMKKRLNHSNYDSDELLDIDIIDQSLISETEDIVKNAERQRIQGYGIDAELRMPEPADLLYTKIHDSYHKESQGTRHDVNVMVDGGAIPIDENRLYELAKNNSEATNNIKELGF